MVGLSQSVLHCLEGKDVDYATATLEDVVDTALQVNLAEVCKIYIN